MKLLLDNYMLKHKLSKIVHSSEKNIANDIIKKLINQ